MRKAVATIEILAGLVGIILAVDLGVRLNAFVGSSWLVIVSILSLIAGYFLYSQKRYGLSLSTLVQLLQLPIITTSHFVYKLGLLLIPVLGFSTAHHDDLIKLNVDLEAYFGVHYSIFIDTNPKASVGSSYSIDILALILLIMLRHIARRESATLPPERPDVQTFASSSAGAKCPTCGRAVLTAGVPCVWCR